MCEIDIYDFDKTVYNGDSSLDFWQFCLVRNPLLIILLPWQIAGILLMKLGLVSEACGKGIFFSFMRFIDGKKRVSQFWEKNEVKINAWFLPENRKRSAVVCSASPEFLLSEICSKYDARLVATVCDIRTGKISGKNCKGEEKVLRLKNEIDIGCVNTVYSDSPKTDAPIFALGVRRVRVENGKRTEF